MTRLTREVEEVRLGGEQAPSLTAWEQRTLDRSLLDARQRALGKSRRFLEAAGEIMIETGGLAFTVHDVVERSELSMGSFYKAFSGKDEMLLALFEESVAVGVAMQQDLIADITDPLEQLEVCLTWLASPRDLVGPDDNPGARALTVLRFTLASSYPLDLMHAMDPQLRILQDAIQRGVAAGQIRTDVSPRRLAEMVWAVAAEANHSSILRTGILDDADAPRNIWQFCRDGLLQRSS
jgi:AcrR family transcriptional regulator